MRWIVKRLFWLLMLILAVAGFSLYMLPADRIAKIAADQLRNVTGRNVTISGDVGMTLWPVLGVSAGKLEVGNAEWAKEGAMLSTQNAAIGVDASALLRGEIRITNITAQSPTIRLESRKDGRASWQFSDGSAAIETETTPGTPARAISIQNLAITDATLIYDAEGSDIVSFSGVDLTLDWPERLGSASIETTLRPAGTKVAVAARIAQFADFLGGVVQPVAARIDAGGGTVTLDGRASLEGAVAGALRLQSKDTALFLAALGIQGVELPEGLGKSADISMDLTLTPDRRLALREVVADLGANALRGAADITLNGTPQVNAQINAGALDLRALTGGDSSTSDDAVGTGWSRAPIDASGLAAFNGAIALSADSINLGALTLGPTRSLLTNDRSRMVFELRDVSAYEGQLSGEFVMNNREGLSVGGNLRAANVQMQPLLSDLMDLSRFRGAANVQVSFLGVGQSVDAIMRSLKGDGSVSVGRGEIEGIDLDALLGSFDATGGTTVFDSLSATFAMTVGVLRNSDLQMLLPNFSTTGAGEIDLGMQTLDYTVTPKALRVNGERGLAVPVRVYGPWADPRIKPDLQAAIDLNFQQEKDRAEQRVKDKAAEKLEKELGVVRQEGQSVEDAVKDRAEDALKRELLRIFD